MTTINFETLNLTQEMMNAIETMGFTEPSPIQSQAIPLMLNEQDIIGQAQTGTGKTAAFAIPVIEKLDPQNKNTQAIILCPTRELVIQVTDEFRKLMRFKEGLVATAIYGGQPIERQLKALRKGTQIVIGTPGRTMDHLRRGSLKVNSIKFVVLDEADEMLDMGFREDIEIILKDAPKERQTVMFSATMPQEIIRLTKQYQQDPVHIDVTDKKMNAPKIKQLFFEVKEKNKPELLARLIDMKNIKLGLVFCNTKSQVDFLVELLKDRDYFADGLHGDLSQNQRDKVMGSFRKGTVQILVATDVAGRGIDVNNIEAVFNYDLPRDDEDYTHRIGRTARAGKTGVAITFVSTVNQMHHLRRIERLNGVMIKQGNVPTVKEIEDAKIFASSDKIQQLLQSSDLDSYICQVEKFVNEDNTILEVAAALLKLSVEKLKSNYDHNINFDDQIDHREPKPRGHQRRDSKRRRYTGKAFSNSRPEGKRSDSSRKDGKKSDGNRFDEKRSDSKRFDGKRSEGKRSETRSGKPQKDSKSYGKKFAAPGSKKRTFKSANNK